jgi:Na+/melibiose symporter-like transporter
MPGAELPLTRAFARSPGGLLAYGLFGMPLAMVALPVYVLVPKLYAESTGLALAAIGAILLGARLLDAFVDPLIGIWVDTERRTRWRPIAIALPALALGFALLLLPPAMSPSAATVWLAATVVVATFGYSLASIAFQAWGAELAHDDPGRARVTTVREAAGLAGVLLAAIVPYAFGVPTLLVLFALVLAVAAALLFGAAPHPVSAVPAPSQSWRAVVIPLATSRFRWLLAVFAVNGVAAAIPASLVLFFIADRLQLEAQSGTFLALYFLAGVLSMPIWAALSRRWPLHAVWLAGMLLAVAAFVGAAEVGPGGFAAFAAICVASGAALGADLALPPALLARVIDANGHGGAREGSYFGLWNLVNKLNLALAAGIALPTLEALGYREGSRDPAALEALAFAYALLPCALKLVAAALIFVAWRARRF